MPGGWERLASHEGGTVVALARVPTGGGEAILFAATTAGLFRSEDGGRRWSSASATPLPLIAAVAPSARFAANRLLFAGTQTGCYRSADAGHTWRQALSGGRVFAIAVVPGASGEETVFVGTQQDGILRSDDGGQTWAGANAGLLDLTVLALAFSPDAARDRTGFAATTSGLYRTRNGGKSWREVAMPLDESAMQCLAISPTFSRDRLVFAGTESDGLWRSDDGGARWEFVPGLPDGGIGAIAFSPTDTDARLVAVATDGGVALSRDDGETWRLSGPALPPVLDLAIVPDDNGETLVAGLYRDGAACLAISASGDHWQPATTGLRATFLTTLVASPAFGLDRTLFVAGTETGLRFSRDGGHTWRSAGGSLTDAAVYGMAISPGSGGRHHVFVATDLGIFRSQDGGMHWQLLAPESDAPMGMIAVGAIMDDGRMPVFAVTLDGHLIASDDSGERWRPLTTPFDGATIVSLTCSPDAARNHTLYVGTIQSTPGVPESEMIVWRSTDGGGGWVRWFAERGGGGILPLVVASEQSGDTLFVGLAGRVMQPRRNGWQMRGGVRAPLWQGTLLTTGDSEAVAITALAVSPHYHADGTVFAATNRGTYRSRDRGRTFDHWSDGLGGAPILALATAAASDATGEDSALVFALGVDGVVWRRGYVRDVP